MSYRASLVLLIALVLVPGLVAAQQPVFTLTIQGAPVAPMNVKAGASGNIPINVNMFAHGFGCAQAATFPVAVSVTGATGRDAVTAAGLNFSVAASAYLPPPPQAPPQPLPAGAPYNQTVAGTIGFRPSAGVEQGYSVTLSVGADFAGGDYTMTGNCIPNPLPAASATPVSVRINVQPDVIPPPPPPTNGNGGGNGGGGNTTGNETDGDDDGGGIPTPWLAVPIGFVLAALTMRRKR